VFDLELVLDAVEDARWVLAEYLASDTFP
jgi:hypothetical protein